MRRGLTAAATTRTACTHHATHTHVHPACPDLPCLPTAHLMSSKPSIVAASACRQAGPPASGTRLRLLASPLCSGSDFASPPSNWGPTPTSTTPRDDPLLPSEPEAAPRGTERKEALLGSWGAGARNRAAASPAAASMAADSTRGSSEGEDWEGRRRGARASAPAATDPASCPAGGSHSAGKHAHRRALSTLFCDLPKLFSH